MLTGGTDPLYRQVLAAGHRHYVRIEVWSGLGAQLPIPTPMGDPEGGLVYESGIMSATLGSRVTRTLNLSIPYHFYPTAPTDLLAPFGNELRVFRGVTLGDGSDGYTWQVFRGKIQDVARSSAGECTLYCTDRASEVVDHAFESPQNSQTSNTVFQEFQRLVLDAVPDANFGVSDAFNTPVRPLTWEYDRGSALDEMATSANGVWYALANGDFVMRDFPWIGNRTPVLTVTDQPGGYVNGWTRSRSRSDIFNIVTVTGERLNGDTPVYATASDTTPSSPSYTLGGFGVKSKLERLQTPATQGAALAAAESLLATYITPIETWTLQIPPDASLELGDVLQVDVDDASVRQVVTGFALPLDLSQNMTISTRSLIINQLERSSL